MRKRKEVPLAEITLRKFEKPYGARKELLRKFCISVGLLQPGDSRDSIVDVFSALLEAAGEQNYLDSDQLAKATDLSKPNLRRHLRRMAELGFVENHSNRYRIREFSNLRDILVEYTKPFLLEPTFRRILDYADKIDGL